MNDDQETCFVCAARGSNHAIYLTLSDWLKQYFVEIEGSLRNGKRR